MTQDLLLVGCLIAMAQMATVWKIQAHHAIMRLHDGLVDLEVGGTAGERLDVDAPLLVIEVEGLESSSLAEQFNGVNVLVTTIVTTSRVALGIFVGHGRAQSVEDSARGNIFRGNEEDRLPLTLNLFFLPPLSLNRDRKTASIP